MLGFTEDAVEYSVSIKAKMFNISIILIVQGRSFIFKIFTPEKKMIGEYGECTKDEISFYFLCITQRLSASSSGHMTAADGEVS